MKQKTIQQKMDALLSDLEAEKRVPSLLLHSCCGPCSSYVLSYLSNYFKITVYFYNPMIFPKEEYEKRKQEQKRLIYEMDSKYPIVFIEGDYEHDIKKFYDISKNVENELEGKERCTRCYAMRLSKTAEKARKEKFDYFATTLSVSPYKNAEKLNKIGNALANYIGVSYLESDFKKKEGYKKSIQLSKEYGLYRQEYCGCRFSLDVLSKKGENV